MKQIDFGDFLSVQLRSGTIIDVQSFPEARNPAYKIWVDFGRNFGVKKTSAQVTNYTKSDLLGKQVIGVLNLAPKQVGTFMSEFLLTAFVDEKGTATLAVPDRSVDDGMKLV